MVKRVSPFEHIAVAACSFALSADGALQLTPAGSFRAKDGRPAGVDGWWIDDATAPAVLARLAARQDDLVIDYEHQTLYTEKNGKPAPAAGWFRGADVTWRPGQGLFVTPEWTAAAKAAIDAKEYRYFSPVMVYDKRTGQVLDIQMGAVVNYAAIDGMAGLQARAAAKFLHNHSDEDGSMKELLKLLGLAPEAPEDQAVTALKALQDKAQAAADQVAALTAEVATKEQAIAAAKAETPGPAMAAIQDLQTELAVLKTSLTQTAVSDLVDQGLADGKLTPSMKDWATDLGNADIAALKGYLDKATPIAALKGRQSANKDLDDKPAELTDTDLAVCKSMGIEPDDYKATRAAG